VNLAMAGVMDEPQIGEIVRATLLLGHHRVDVERLAIFERLVRNGAQTLSHYSTSYGSLGDQTGHVAARVLRVFLPFTAFGDHQGWENA
jgi:hypothetical protein